MAWIETIAPEGATGELARHYARVASADGQVDTTRFVGRVIGDDAVHDLAVRHDDLLVVAGLQNGRQYLNLLNDTRDARCFIKMPNIGFD